MTNFQTDLRGLLRRPISKVYLFLPFLIAIFAVIYPMFPAAKLDTYIARLAYQGLNGYEITLNVALVRNIVPWGIICILMLPKRKSFHSWNSMILNYFILLVLYSISLVISVFIVTSAAFIFAPDYLMFDVAFELFDITPVIRAFPFYGAFLLLILSLSTLFSSRSFTLLIVSIFVICIVLLFLFLPNPSNRWFKILTPVFYVIFYLIGSRGYKFSPL